MPTREELDSGIAVESEKKVKKPDMYKVIIHNDDYTSMDFVVQILTDIFHLPVAKATQIMLDVHQKGKGIVGVYTYDIAVTKVNLVHERAKENGFPLRCSIEKE